MTPSQVSFQKRKVVYDRIYYEKNQEGGKNPLHLHVK